MFSIGEVTVKFAFVVSKKIDTSAVVRNKTKRVLKKAVKQLLTRVKNGYGIIIIAKSKLEFSQEETVEKELEIALSKAKIIK